MKTETPTAFDSRYKEENFEQSSQIKPSQFHRNPADLGFSDDRHEDMATSKRDDVEVSKNRPVVFVPTDFSEGAAQVIDLGLRLAHKIKGRLVLFHAVHLNLSPYGPADPNRLAFSLCSEAMGLAEPFLERAQALKVPAFCVVDQGPQPTAILRAAEKWGADMILMLDRERMWFERIFRRKTFERVVKGARCPVLSLQMNRKKISN